MNTTTGSGGGYNDGQPHFIGGFGLNFPTANLVALSHMGAEDPAGSLPPGVDIHKQYRFENDITFTWQVNDKLTSVTELNYIKDDGFNVWGGGGSEYLFYPLSRTVTAGLRAEVWRDAQGFFVRGYPGNQDYVDEEDGLPNSSYSGGPATYGAVTLGLNITPSGLPKMIDGLTIRPEIRFDRVLSSGSPFGHIPLTEKSQTTVGVDVVAPFGIGRGPADRTNDGPMATVAETAEALGALTPGTLEGSGAPTAPLDLARNAASRVTPVIAIGDLAYAAVPAAQMPGMGLVIDGAFVGGDSSQLIDSFNVASVKVTSGPSDLAQGKTLIDGVIDVQRARPTRRFSVEGGYGLEQGFHTNIENLVINVPVGSTAGLSISGAHEEREGYFDNLYNGNELYGGTEVSTGTLQFDWNVTSKLEANVSATLTHQNGSSTAQALGDPLTARLNGPSLAATIPGLAFNAYGSPYVPGVTVPLGPWRVANDFPDQAVLNSQIYGLTLDYDTAIGQFKSITSYLRQTSDSQQDLDGSCNPAPIGGEPCQVLANPLVGILNSSQQTVHNQWTEEFRFTHRFGQRARLISGLYYDYDDTSQTRLTLSDSPGEIAPSPPTRQTGYELHQSVALFADLTFNVTNRLRLGAGIRYLNETTDYHQAVGVATGSMGGMDGAPLTASAGSQQADRVLTRFTIDYQLTQTSRLYALRSTGFQAGGQAPGTTLSEQIPGQTNYDPANPSANYSTFQAETNAWYEIGSKNDFFDDQLTVNAMAFLNEDSNRQVSELVLTPGYGAGTNSYVVNLPKVRIAGAELEVDYRPQPAPGLTLTALAGYQNARITNGVVAGVAAPVNINATAGAPGTTYDLTGTALERTPSTNFALRGDYWRRFGAGVVDLNVGYVWTAKYAFADLAGQPDFQPSFGLLDLSLSYRQDFYALIVSAKNLLNTVYLTDAQPSLFVHGWGDPRTVVVELQVKF